MTVKTLIDKAAEKVGNKSKLADLLGLTKSQIYEWRSGVKRCSPADRARLADLAGEDALQELVRATLEETAGTTRGEQLKSVLGKSSRQIGAALNTVIVGVMFLTFGLVSLDLPRCIKSHK